MIDTMELGRGTCIGENCACSFASNEQYSGIVEFRAIYGMGMELFTRLDIHDARLMIAASERRAEALGVAGCIAVADDSGQLIAFARMVGGSVASSTIAIDKAFTAAAAQKATHEYGEESQPWEPAYGMFSAIGGRLIVVAGGLPVIWNGRVIGGIGVSSMSPRQDQLIAEVGVEHWNLHQRTNARLDA